MSWLSPMKILGFLTKEAFFIFWTILSVFSTDTFRPNHRHTSEKSTASWRWTSFSAQRQVSSAKINSRSYNISPFDLDWQILKKFLSDLTLSFIPVCSSLWRVISTIIENIMLKIRVEFESPCRRPTNISNGSESFPSILT